MTNENTDRFVWKASDIEITKKAETTAEDGQETHVHEDMDPEHDGRTHTHEAGKPITHEAK